VPATCNKAGANYRSEVTHLEYAPRRAYDEWLAICEAVVTCGGDALFEFEEEDLPLLDGGDLSVDPGGAIHPAGSADPVGHMDEVMTGRVFTANGPWVVVEEQSMRALMPNMLAHRQREGSYYARLLGRLAELAGCDLTVTDNPHRWEGMADVAAIGEQVVLSYAVPGHYDRGLAAKTARSSREGVDHAADFAGVATDARIYAELSYPHFHGDTVHFCARPTSARGPVLVGYPGGLYGDGAERVARVLGRDQIVEISRRDAVEAYAANSRQVGGGLLVPEEASASFVAAIEGLGLSALRVPLAELFGKAGGGPACATLQMPGNLDLDARAPMRYSVRRAEAHAHRERVPERLFVDAAFFADKARG